MEYKEYFKDFDSWNGAKKSLELVERNERFYFHEREIWWAAIGVNIGSEIDGKNDNFERPVLVVRKINNHQFIGVPLTSRDKTGWAYELIKYPKHLEDEIIQIEGSACLTQMKVMSSKRLLRKMSVVKSEDFLRIKIRLTQELLKEERKKSDPTVLPVGSSEAEATNV